MVKPLSIHILLCKMKVYPYTVKDVKMIAMENAKFETVIFKIQSCIYCWTLSQNKPLFLFVRSTSLLKTLWEKEEIDHNKQVLLLLRCFLPFWRTFCCFHEIQIFYLQTLLVWKSIKFCHLGKG